LIHTHEEGHHRPMTGVDNMVPLALRGTSAVIAEQLRERILDGSFAPGEQISEVQLAARLGLSRGPVREAVQRLAQEGLLVSHRNRGVFVDELDHADIEDVYRGRRAVEKEAACTVYERGVPAGLVDRLEVILRNMGRYMNAGDWPKLAREDLLFHETMVEAAQSPRLSRMFSTLAAETMLCLSAFDERYIRPPTAVEEHQRLLDLLVGGDLAELLAEIDRHTAHAVDSLTKARGARVDGGSTDR
jgi:DNA-binding GntR family transcriptional regulator